MYIEKGFESLDHNFVIFWSWEKCSPKWCDICIFIHSWIRKSFFIKNDSSIEGIKVFAYVFLYTVYADDSMFNDSRFSFS